MRLINAVVYSLFLLYFLTFVITSGHTSFTQGEVVGLHEEKFAIHSKVAPYVRYAAHFLVELDTPDGVKKFRLKPSERESCHWPSTTKVKIEHHFFWYGSIWHNKIVSCE